MKTVLPLLFLLALGCGRSTDLQLNADEKELAAVYVKLVLLQEKLSVEHPAYPDSMQAVLNRHGMTRERYDLILASLNRTPERWPVFYREALKALEASPPLPVAAPVQSKEASVKREGAAASPVDQPVAGPVPRAPSGKKP
ncbi:hypothetical protein JW906_03470 [bacterium]|nr:hypothetical protein [bacterium]